MRLSNRHLRRLALASPALLWAACIVHLEERRECTSADGGSSRCRLGETCEESACRLDWEALRWPVSGVSPPSGELEVDESAGTVTDHTTNLVWRRDYSEGGSWTAAEAYCTALSEAGVRWRLPTRVELLSIVDPARPLQERAIDQDAFGKTPGDWFWTSTRRPTDAAAFCALFYSGSGVFQKEAPGDGGAFPRARCVRSLVERADTPTGVRYSVDGGVVEDRVARLTWQQASSATSMPWSEALKHCNPDAGWRLPSKRELETLVDLRNRPTIDPAAFPDTPREAFWTSPVAGYDPTKAFTVEFDDGDTRPLLISDGGAYVRCVR